MSSEIRLNYAQTNSIMTVGIHCTAPVLSSSGAEKADTRAVLVTSGAFTLTNVI